MGNYSSNLNKRISNRGPKEGYCVICGGYGKLSRDHVPPKGCNNLSDTEIKSLLPDKEYSIKGTTSQGGTHYKTLCAACNNTRLGTQYDPHLVELSNAITSYVVGAKNRHIDLPRKIEVFFRPQRIARAVVGHCLAALAVDEAKNGVVSSPMGDAMRTYFLDEKACVPDELDIYYWMYPSRRQVVMKGFSKFSLFSKQGDTFVSDLLKFLPLGFWITWEKPKHVQLGVDKLIARKDMPLDEPVLVELDLYQIPRLDFPESPIDHEAILLHDEYAAVATPK